MTDDDPIFSYADALDDGPCVETEHEPPPCPSVILANRRTLRSLAHVHHGRVTWARAEASTGIPSSLLRAWWYGRPMSVERVATMRLHLHTLNRVCSGSYRTTA
jgi:hypothetical protein